MPKQEENVKKVILYLSSDEGRVKLAKIAKQLELQKAMLEKSRRLTFEQLNTPFNI